MIYGIGNDILEISRIEKAIKNEKFIHRVYTDRELEEIQKKGNRNESYTGKFSAKEAVSKALNTGIRGFELKDIEILNDQLGKPYVNLIGDLSEKYKDIKIYVTISHCKEYATAMALAYIDQDKK